ncbi:hypothetical protein CR513_42004, partial [Mucuna pruriens]
IGKACEQYTLYQICEPQDPQNQMLYKVHQETKPDLSELIEIHCFLASTQKHEIEVTWIGQDTHAFTINLMLEICSSCTNIIPKYSPVCTNRQHNLLMLHTSNSHDSRRVKIPVQCLWLPLVLTILLAPKYNSMVTSTSYKTCIFPGHKNNAIDNSLNMRLVLQEFYTFSLLHHQHCILKIGCFLLGAKLNLRAISSAFGMHNQYC